MTAEPIAELVRDLRRGWVDNPLSEDAKPVYDAALGFARRIQPVVDVTAVYWDMRRKVVDNDGSLDMYNDFPCITPPWEHSLYAFVNRHGNTLACQINRVPADKAAAYPWETENEVSWDRVRWVAEMFLWCGGKTGQGWSYPRPVGPVDLQRWAIYEDGAPADLRWIHVLPEVPLETWEAAHAVALMSLNFLNCVNVEAAEPARPRPARRRLQRTGVQVKTLTVRPASRSSRSEGSAGQGGMPLTSVRGHFAEYGPRYGKGKLFGRLEGRFWIPAHARGSEEHGVVAKDYRLQPRPDPAE